MLNARWIVIEGFRIEMAAQELIGYLGDRAEHHRDAAIECDRRRARATSSTSRLDSADPDEQLGALWPAWVGELDEYAAEHRRREAAFVFLRDHVPAHEVYRLDWSDMRFLEIWPARRLKQERDAVFDDQR